MDLRHATDTITAIARDADVDFNDARRVLLTHLTTELGELMNRIPFPPENAVRPDCEAGDDGLSEHPVRL